jgi:hypothetical protein
MHAYIFTYVIHTHTHTQIETPNFPIISKRSSTKKKLETQLLLAKCNIPRNSRQMAAKWVKQFRPFLPGSEHGSRFVRGEVRWSESLFLYVEIIRNVKNELAQSCQL